MTLKVLADLHHGDLFWSLHRLFEERLGWELYRPIGLDWFEQGFWKIAEPYGNPPDTINQYLSLTSHPWDKNVYSGDYIVEDGVYRRLNITHDYWHKAITLEKFKEMSFDLIISTYEPHDRPYEILRDTYQPKAKLIAQMGNVGQKTRLKNVLHSVPYTPQSGQHALFYHQEVDLRYWRYERPDPTTKKIFGMVNCFPYPDVYKQFKAAMSDIDMRHYGLACPDDYLVGGQAIAAKMREANLAWHLKPLGGIGHSTMGWFLTGRPLITNMSQHRSFGGEAVQLFVPGLTCIDIEAQPFDDTIRMIRSWLDPDNNLVHAEAVRKRFDELVNYDQEEQQIRKFLENLL